MAEVFEVKILKSEGDVAVIELHGSIEGDASIRLVDTFRTLQAQGRQHVIADFGKVTFINSSGVGSLLVIDKEFEDAGGEAHFVNLVNEVLNVIKILHLDEELKIADSVEAALTHVAS